MYTSHLMKATVILLVVSLFMFSVFSATAQDSTNYQSELERYQAMKRSGRNLIIAGVPTIGAGTFLIIAGRKGYTFFNLFNIEERTVAVGIIVTIVGVTLEIAGITRNNNGKQGIKEYQSKLDNLKVGSYLTPKHAGITLSYRF